MKLMQQIHKNNFHLKYNTTIQLLFENESNDVEGVNSLVYGLCSCTVYVWGHHKENV